MCGSVLSSLQRETLHNFTVYQSCQSNNIFITDHFGPEGCMVIVYCIPNRVHHYLISRVNLSADNNEPMNLHQRPFHPSVIFTKSHPMNHTQTFPQPPPRLHDCLCWSWGEKLRLWCQGFFLFVVFFFRPWHAVILPVDVLLGKNRAKGTRVSPNNCNQNYQPNKQKLENR